MVVGGHPVAPRRPPGPADTPPATAGAPPLYLPSNAASPAGATFGNGVAAGAGARTAGGETRGRDAGRGFASGPGADWKRSSDRTGLDIGRAIAGYNAIA